MAEETGVDAESEEPAVSPNGQEQSAGQRTSRQDEEPDTGMQTHTFTEDWCTHWQNCRPFKSDCDFSFSNAASKEKEK